MSFEWNNIQKWIVRYADDEHAQIYELQEWIMVEGIDGNPSPLHLSTTGCNTQITKLLIANNANLNANDKEGRTPLHWACSRGNLRMVKVLTDFGAELNVVDHEYCTVLHYAAQSGSLDVVKFLVEEKKMDLIYKNVDLQTPLDIALENEEMEVVEYLKEKIDDKTTRRHSKSKLLKTSQQSPKSKSKGKLLQASPSTSHIIKKFSPAMKRCTKHTKSKSLQNY